MISCNLDADPFGRVFCEPPHFFEIQSLERCALAGSIIATTPALWVKLKLGLDFRPKITKNSMDFQLKLTFIGKSHKNDPDFRSHKSLETLIIRRTRTLTIIRVQTAIRQLKMEKDSIKTILKFAILKNGGKLEKTCYTKNSVRSPKTERAPSQPVIVAPACGPRVHG